MHICPVQATSFVKVLIIKLHIALSSSVTRLGDLLDFGQLFKACGNNYLAQIVHILVHYFKGVKIVQFSIVIIFW